MRTLIFEKIVLIAAVLGSGGATAGSLLEFHVETKGRNISQPVLIKDGRLLIKGAGGDENLDLLYLRDGDRLTLIDHKKHRFTDVTQRKIDQLAQQTEELQPVMRGLGEQLKKLSPKQREKWADMLGGVDLDQLSGAKSTAAKTQVISLGSGKKIAGIDCDRVDIRSNGSIAGELCIADPGQLKLPEDDAATVASLLQFSQKVASRAQRVAGQFGIALPSNGIDQINGVPIEMRDLSGKHPTVMTLSRIVEASATGEELRVPDGYQPKDLALWR